MGFVVPEFPDPTIGLCGGLVCGFHELCSISLMEQGANEQAVRASPRSDGSLHISSGAGKLLFSETLCPASILSGKPLSPVIIDVPRGSHSKGLCGAH